MSETDIHTPATPSTAPAPVPPGSAGNKGEGEFIEYTRARQTMSRRIAESKATIPHIYLQATVDAEGIVELRDRSRDGSDATAGPVPTVNDLVIKAAGLALRNHPRANGTWLDGGVQLHGRINIGVAVDTDDGSVTPVVTDADSRSLEEISIEIRRLAERARTGEITPPEQAGATFAISNLGMLGINSSQPVVNPGQSAKLAVGAVSAQPVVRDGKVKPGWVMELTLSCDHRVLHGGEAARFLAEVRDRLEDPDSLT